MALDLFRVIDGVAIQTTDFADEAHQLVGDGAPVGTTGRTADAPVGSLWLRTDAETDGLNLYWKWQDTDAAIDWKQAASKDYVDNTVQSISWREPVRYRDSNAYASIAAAVADLNAGDDLTGEGSVQAGDRILFPSMGGGDGGPNVYIVGGSSGAWTLTEDTNDETDGDAILVNEGSSADEQWIYDGTNWIQFGGAGSATELTNIRNYIGKPTPGAVFPQYQSNLILSDNDDLTTGAGKLDLHLGDAQYSSNNIVTDFTPDYTNVAPTDWTGETGDNITDAIGAIDSQFGDGDITNDGGNYPLSDDLNWNAGGTLTITAAFDELNNAVGDRTYTNDYIVSDGQSVAESIDDLDSEMGDLDTAGSWTAGGLISQGDAATNTIQENLDELNQAAGADNIQNYTNTVTNITVLTELESGTLADTTASEVLWHIQARSNTTSANRQAAVVHALTEPGSNSADWNFASVLTLGAGPGALNLNVTVTGGNWSVTVNPVSATDITVKRYSFSYLA